MKDTGGQAFPVSFSNSDDIREIQCLDGMTLRDYFAGQALLLAEKHLYVDKQGIAKCCYEIADAMIAERNKNNG